MIESATQAWRRKFAKIASAFPDRTFAIADEEENSDLLKEFSFDESSEEINIGIIDGKERKYAMKPMEEYEADEVVSFLNKFKKGEQLFCLFGLVRLFKLCPS